MEDKKHVKISLGTAICIVIIFLLVIALILLGCYTYVLKNSANKTSNTDVADASQSTNDNTPKNEVTKPVADVGTELNVNDSIVKSLTDKIDFNTNARASIYKVGSFNSNNISNDLILKLGWDSIKDKKQVEGLSPLPDEVVTKKEMAQSISNLFGPKIKYTDTSFAIVDIETFHGYQGLVGDTVNYSNNSYSVELFQGGGGDCPFIQEQVTKALQYNNKIEIYVKTAFVDTKYVESSDSFEYILYKDFNFATNTFNNQLSKIAATQKMPELSSDFNTYVYTFDLDSSSGNYYLSGFNMAK